MSDPEVPGDAEEAASSDGRHRRSQRSRERILDALEEAVRAESGEVTAEVVAARAGVSLSTLFRHFGDLAGLQAAMRKRVGARVLPVFALGAFEGPRRARVRELLRRRAEIFEMLGPFRRQSLRDPGPSLSARQVEQTLEVMLRTQITEALQPELDAPGAGERLEVLVALLSFEAWDRMRRTQGLEVAQTVALLEDAVLKLLKEPS